MKAFDYSLVKDPQYFCDNRMEAHSDHVYYRDKKEMQTALQEVEMQLQMLAVSARQVHGIMRMKCALHLDGECLIRILNSRSQG